MNKMESGERGLGFPAKLVCPHCRVPGPNGTLVVSYLEPVSDARGPLLSDRCALCGTCYPRIAGIACVPPDLAAFREAQAAMLEFDWASADLPKAEALCRLAGDLDPMGNTFRELSHLALHALAHFPGASGNLSSELDGNRLVLDTVRDWLREKECPEQPRAGCALEAGCGPGAMLHAVAPLFEGGALGLDLRIGTLRLARRMAESGEAFLPFCAEGRRFEPVRIQAGDALRPQAGSICLVQGDVLAPPLEAEAYQAVIALSLLDSVPDPMFALGQLDALLEPGGLLLLGTPYGWDSRVTPPQAWWARTGMTSESTLRDALAGHHPTLPHLRYEVLREAGRLAWALPGHRRLVYRFFLDLVLARKIPSSSSLSPK